MAIYTTVTCLFTTNVFIFPDVCCTSKGDPKITTFDGMEYFFSGGCEYIMLKAIVNDSKLLVTHNDKNCTRGLDFCPRSVNITIWERGSSRKRQQAAVKKIDIRIRDGEVFVDGKKVNLPYDKDGKHNLLYKVQNIKYII